MRKTLTLLFLALCTLSYAQYYKRAQLDSLEIAVKTQNGIEEINTLLELGNAYYNFQLDTAQLYVHLVREKAKRENYSWGICKTYVLESDIHFRKGLSNVEKVRSIKNRCADWFLKNNFKKDALITRLSANFEVEFGEGKRKAFEDAKRLLQEARDLGDISTLALAWRRIDQTSTSFFNHQRFPGSMDSCIFYLNEIRDSSNIVSIHCKKLFIQHGGRIPTNEIQKLESMAHRWELPILWILIEKLKYYPYIQQGNMDSTLTYARHVNELEQNYGGSDVYWPIRNLVALAHAQNNEHVARINLLQEEVQLNTKYGIRTALQNNYYQLAEAHFSLNDYDLAIINFLKSLELSEQMEDDYTSNSIKRRLGDLYVITGEFSKAEKQYLEMINWAEENNKDNILITIMQGNACNSLARLYQKEKKYDLALIRYKESYEYLGYNLNRKIEPKTGLLSMYVDMKLFARADSLHTEILGQITPEIAYKFNPFRLEEGRLFIERKKYKEGIESLNAYLENAAGQNISEEKKEVHFLLYRAHKELKQEAEALLSFEKYKYIEDSLELSAVTQNVQKIQSDYELSLKESEIENLIQQQEIADLKLTQQENTLALRKLYIVLLVFVLIILVGIAYLFFRRFQFKKEKEKAEIKRQLEIENLKSQQKVELAEVKNNLYANISHEFKTPLTLIRVPLIGFKEVIPAEDQLALDSVIKNTDHLLEMLDELLGVSKMESGAVELSPAYFDLGHFLARIKLNFSLLFAEKNIRFDWDVMLKKSQFFGDEGKLNIVVNNLLKNAFNHTPKSGWVRCEIRCDKALQIRVTNSGKQISEADLPHIFERFYRSKDSDYNGTGIGLAWSNQIVTLHGGEISVDNSKNEQVSFEVLIPEMQVWQEELKNHELEGDTADNPIPKIQPDQRLPHILVVEDNAEMRTLLQTVLEQEFRLDFAENGQIGEEKAIQLQPDLVLSDIMMPEKDGFELLASLRQNFNSSHIPVILLTARSDSESRILGFNQDADDYVGKPFDPVELKARINNLLRKRIHLHKLFSENPFLYSKEIECTSIDADFIDRARKILDLHYSNGDFTVPEFCRELASNRTSVNNKLQALANQSTAEYIRNYRLEKASRKLLETNFSVVEIAIDTGFNTPQVFNKAFKKKFECTPGEYRTRHLQLHRKL